MHRLALPAALFLALIVAANYATNTYGMTPVGFGLVATAGTFLAGATFVVRDMVQDAERATAPTRHVPVVTLSLIVAGAALSWLVSPALAVASGVAFLIAEAVDLVAYTPLRSRGYVRAAIVSNALGAIVDTFVFLHLAGFPVTTAGVAGQLVGKAWVTVLAVAIVVGVRAYARRARPATVA